MDTHIEFGGSLGANAAMRSLAELAVERNGGEPIVPKPEDIAALEAARTRLASAGIYTGPCAVKDSVAIPTGSS